MSRAALVAAAMTAACSKPADPAIVAEPPAASSKVEAPSASVAASALSGVGPAEDAGYAGLGLTGVGLGAAYGAPAPPGLGVGTVEPLPHRQFTIAITSGGATPDDVATLARGRWRFKACAQKAAAHDPTLEGQLTLATTIQVDGTASSTTTTISGNVGPPFSLCAVSALATTKFAARAAPLKCRFTVDVKPGP